MKQIIIAIIAIIMTVALLTPITILGYGIILGHTFTGTQLNAAGIMAIAGIFTGTMAAIAVTEIPS